LFVIPTAKHLVSYKKKGSRLHKSCSDLFLDTEPSVPAGKQEIYTASWWERCL